MGYLTSLVCRIGYGHDFSSNQFKIEADSDFGLPFEVRGAFFHIKKDSVNLNRLIQKDIKHETAKYCLPSGSIKYKVILGNEISSREKHKVLLSSENGGQEYVIEFRSYKNRLEPLGIYKVW